MVYQLPYSFCYRQAYINDLLLSDMNEMGGLGKIAPNLSVFYVLAIMASIGLPGFANFLGEFVIFAAIAEQESLVVGPFVSALGIIISAIYGLRSIGNVVFGAPVKCNGEEEVELNDMKMFEKLPALLLLGSLMIIGIFPKLLSDKANGDLIHLYGDQEMILEEISRSDEYQNLND